MIELSVVITSHNQAENVIKICETVAQDDLDGAEVIVIDDCSDDGAKLDNWYWLRMSGGLARNRFTISQTATRSGAGGARNLGEMLAGGRYVWFVDGDDEIFRGAIPRIVKHIRGGCDADIVMLPYTEGWEGNTRVHTIEPDQVPPKPYQWRIAPWGKLIKRDIFVPFCERCFYEDTDWHFLQCDKAKTRDFLPGGPVYFYRRNPNELSQMSGIQRLEAATRRRPRPNVEQMLAEGDHVLNYAVAERLQMIGRLMENADTRIKNVEIKKYAAWFCQAMLETIQPTLTIE